MSATLPPFAAKAEGEGWFLAVRVQPGAKKSEYVGVADNRLRIRLAAPAVENKANKALIAFIAQTLGLRSAKVRLISGETSRLKRVLISSEEEPDWRIFTG